MFIPVNGGGQIYPSRNLSNSHSPSRSIHGVLFLQTNTLALLLHLHLPCLLWSSSLPLAPMLFSEGAYHPSSTHAHTISLHSPLPSESLFPSILASPSGPLFSFSPLLSRFFLKLPSHFPSNTMSHSHITSPILKNSDKPYLLASARTFLSSATPYIP